MPEPSSERGARPPRFVEAILSRLLPERDREPILGDLAEEYTRRAQSDGFIRARRWYRRQFIRAVLPAMRRRLQTPKSANTRVEGRMGKGGFVFSWLDVKLSLRMLRKRPVMTAAALFALGVGIPASMVPGHVANVLEAPLPEDPDDRVRSVRYWDQAGSVPAQPTYFEFARWRAELTTFASLGAFRPREYNLRSEGGQPAPVMGAEVTASTFEILQAAPQLGRTLDRRDEAPGGPDVVVIGHDLWQGRLAADPNAIGATLQVGGVPHTIVGVMPDDFLFPALQQLWLPLREELLVEPATGRGLQVFGRLTERVSPEDAHAEVAAFGSRTAVDFPGTNARLTVEVVRFGTAELNLPRGGWAAMSDSYLLGALALILLAVACCNVAMLVFASTATRFRELAIRTSLGASRARIVSQMFIESLLISVGAAGVGLLCFDWIMGQVRTGLLNSESVRFPPYWLEFGLTAEMAWGALGVAVFSASIAGVLPAIKVTGSKVQENIRKAEAGHSGIRFGGVTGALVIADVAIAVAVVGLAVGTGSQIVETLNADERVSIAADQYLAVELSLPSDESVTSGGELRPEEFTARLAATQQTLVERLEAEPQVRSVAVADRLPRQDHVFRRFAIEGETTWMTVEGRPGAIAPPTLPVARIDLDFFNALGQPILAGRGFDQADLTDSASAVIVNTSFVERRLGGRNPLGQRIRFWEGSFQGGALGERWYEIVGMVGPLGMNVAMPEQDGGIYLPAAPGDIHPMRLAVHLDGNPETFTPRLREIVSEVDPLAILQPPQVLSQVYQGMWFFYLGTIVALTIIVGILVALAASGIFAIMSFAVSERTREIGIRRSLGERAAALAVRIGRRSLVQIALGAALGVWPAMQLYRLTQLGYTPPTATSGLGAALVSGVVIAFLIGLLACVSPTRRALNIEPAEALRGEG